MTEHEQQHIGRPAADPKNPRVVRLQVVVSQRDHELITAERDKTGQTESDWIYKAMQPAMRRLYRQARKQ